MRDCVMALLKPPVVHEAKKRRTVARRLGAFKRAWGLIRYRIIRMAFTNDLRVTQDDSAHGQRRAVFTAAGLRDLIIPQS